MYATELPQPAAGPAVGVVVITHGLLATELLNAAEMIVGDLPRFTAVSIGWHDDVTVATDAMARAITRVDSGSGVLLLTDMFGGTSSNLAMTFLEAGRVEVVTGIKLAMLDQLGRATATGKGNKKGYAGGALPFAALLVGNAALALGPWLVRLTDTGPVAAGFWRLALPLPLFLWLAWRELAGRRIGAAFGRRTTLVLLAAGAFFAFDLASWHVGIELTRLGNATLLIFSSWIIFFNARRACATCCKEAEPGCPL